MKRFVTTLLILLVLCILCVYVFIPATLKVSTVAVVNVSTPAAFRVISEPANWTKWAEVQKPGADTIITSFVKNKSCFAVNKILHNALEISIDRNELHSRSLLSLLPVTKDSMVIRWETEVPAGHDPVSKIQHYLAAVKIKNDMAAITTNLQQYLANTKNVYGYDFSVATTTDTLLVAIKTKYDIYPSNEALYNEIRKLEQYARSKGAKQVAPPMMNVTNEGDGKYQLMVALPVDKVIGDEGEFLHRKLVYGNFLITEVRGGNNAVNHALEMMKDYIDDVGKTAMAIPFQVLVTNRQQEPDSAKWISKIYYPVIR